MGMSPVEEMLARAPRFPRDSAPIVTALSRCEPAAKGVAGDAGRGDVGQAP
jgi:hypothetical protein